MSEETFFIGDFPVDPSAIPENNVEIGKEITFEVDKSERKTYDGKDGKPGGAYNALTLKLPDHPGPTVFHSYFLNAEAFGDVSSARSWKRFLTQVNLPFDTSAANNGVKGLKFRGILREDKANEKLVLQKVVGPA